MPNIMIVGKHNVFGSRINRTVLELMQSLGFNDETAIVTVVGKDETRKGERILMYGFSRLGENKAMEISYEIMKKTGLDVVPVESSCWTVGNKQDFAPHLVVMLNPTKIDKLMKDLQFLQLGYDTEIHLVGSNVSPKAGMPFYVRVKLLEEEAEHLCSIITSLRGIGIAREQIWADIIRDFIPG